MVIRFMTSTTDFVWDRKVWNKMTLSEEEKKARQRAYSKKHSHGFKGKAARKKWLAENQNKIRIDRRSAWRKLKREVYEKLGNKCKTCGFTDQRALQVDHINGGGHKERKKSGTRKVLLEALSDNGNKYQLLCANHNWIKRCENNEVPRLVDKTKPKPHTSEPAYPSTFRKIDKEKVRSEVIKIIRENKKLEEENTPKGEEISVVVTQVENNPPKTTYFTVDGTTVPRDQVTKSGDRFFRTVS